MGAADADTERPQPDADGEVDVQVEQGSRGAARTRDLEVAAEVDLGDDRPDAAGQVLAELAQQVDARGGRHRQWRAEPGEQRPPRQHVGQQGRENGGGRQRHGQGMELAEGLDEVVALLLHRPREQPDRGQAQDDPQDLAQAADGTAPFGPTLPVRCHDAGTYPP